MLRGDIHEFRLPRGIGHEQAGRRYGRDRQGQRIPATLGDSGRANLTQRQAGVVPPEIDLLGEPTRVLVEQTGAVNAGRLGELVGRVSPEQQWSIDEALTTVLGLRQERAQVISQCHP